MGSSSNCSIIARRVPGGISRFKSCPAVRADVQGSVAPFPVRGNPFEGPLPRSCRAPRSPQELGTFHLSNIVHLCTKHSDPRPASSLPAGRRAKTSTVVHGAASHWKPSLGSDSWVLACVSFQFRPSPSANSSRSRCLAEQAVRGESPLLFLDQCAGHQWKRGQTHFLRRQGRDEQAASEVVEAGGVEAPSEKARTAAPTAVTEVVAKPVQGLLGF